MKPNHVYQYIDFPKSIGKGPLKPKSYPVYVCIQSIKDNTAKCQVLLVKKQIPNFRLRKNTIVHIPIGNLQLPDVFPKHNAKLKWMRLVHQPVVESALEVMDVFPELKKTVSACLVTAKVQVGDLKVGQIWEKGSDKLTIKKKWHQYYFVKDKFGDVKKFSANELVEKLQKYKAKKMFNLPSLLNSIGVLLAPFLGTLVTITLIKIIKTFIARKV